MRRVVSWLTEYSYRKALLVLVAVVLVVGFGAYTMTRVREELLPDISFPVITVIARSPGDQPQNIAQTVTTPIESAVAGLPGVREDLLHRRVGPRRHDAQLRLRHGPQ